MEYKFLFCDSTSGRWTILQLAQFLPHLHKLACEPGDTICMAISSTISIALDICQLSMITKNHIRCSDIIQHHFITDKESHNSQCPLSKLEGSLQFIYNVGTNQSTGEDEECDSRFCLTVFFWRLLQVRTK